MAVIRHCRIESRIVDSQLCLEALHDLLVREAAVAVHVDRTEPAVRIGADVRHRQHRVHGRSREWARAVSGLDPFLRRLQPIEVTGHAPALTTEEHTNRRLVQRLETDRALGVALGGGARLVLI
eukprot:638639-Prymnesium_polylepis.1